MTIEQVMAILNELAESKGVTFNIPVSVNGRLTRTLGRVSHSVRGGKVTPDRMEFSRQLLETSTEESIISVIKHEFAHWYITYTTGENHGHDRAFKEVCRSIGCENDGTSTTVDRVVEVKTKYQIFCSGCGKLVAERSRACKTTTHPHLYTSGCCKEALKVVQNW